MAAAASSHSPLAFFIATFCVLLTPSLCAQKIPRCPEELWSIQYKKNANEGHAKLVFTPSGLSKNNIESVQTILTCTDLEVKGTGKSAISVTEEEKSTSHEISVQNAKNAKQIKKQAGWQAYDCVLQLTTISKSKSKEVECAVKIKTVFGRIIPRCNLMRAKPLLKKVEIKKKDGQVLLHFKKSGNEVYTHDSKCAVGNIDKHNVTTAMEENMIPLVPPGGANRVIDIDFSPDCDNKTVSDKYQKMELSKCHMEIFQICQEGHQLIKYVELKFMKGALKCEKPKSILSKSLEKLELTFFIDSKPVVGLIILLCFNLILYLLLIPVLIWKMVKRYKGPVKKQAPKKKKAVPDERQPLLQNAQSPPVSPIKLTRRPLSPPSPPPPLSAPPPPPPPPPLLSPSLYSPPSPPKPSVAIIPSPSPAAP